MSLDKGVEYGKERRRDYQGSKRFDRSCRNHGSCGYCRAGREHSGKKRQLSAMEKMNDYENNA